MSMKWVLAIGVGLVGGWAARSLADSPEGAGVKLLEIALKTKERVGRWAARVRAVWGLWCRQAPAPTHNRNERPVGTDGGHRDVPLADIRNCPETASFCALLPSSELGARWG